MALLMLNNDGKSRSSSLLRNLLDRLRCSGRYRPELHYMRGPGPASLAKQSRASATQTEDKTFGAEDLADPVEGHS